PQGGQQHHPVRQFGVPPHQDGAQDIVRQADHHHPVDHQNSRGHLVVGGKQGGRRRRPHQARAHGGNQRQQGHDHPPQQRPRNRQNPEDNAPQGALDQSHHQVSLDGGAGDFGKFAKQQALPLIPQGQRPD